jgi:hypothetical protein
MTLDLSIGAEAMLEYCGEPVVVRLPSIEGGREVLAIVDREPAAMSLTIAPGTLAPRAQIHLRNSATHGISTQELDLGKLRIEFPPRVGAAAVPHSIASVVRQDAGWIVLQT